MNGSAVLCGFYGRRNLGDEALLSGLLKSLAEAGQPTGHHVITTNPRAVQADHHVSSSHWDGTTSGRRAVVRDARLARQLVRHPYFILGGGDLLRDSPSQDVAQVWLRPAALALRLRRQVGIVGVSVGEIRRADTRRMIRQTLDACGLVTVRDRSSADALRSMDVHVPIHVLPDLALTLVEPRCTPSGYTVVVCIRGLADRATPAAVSGLDQALTGLADALRSLPPEVSVQLVPLRSSAATFGPVDDDYVAALQFLAQHRLDRDVDVVRHVPDVASLIQLLADAHVVIGMRLHSLVLAVGLDRPVIGLAYDRKVTGFLDDLGGEGASRPLADISGSWLTTRIQAALFDGDRGYSQELAGQARDDSSTLARLLRSW